MHPSGRMFVPRTSNVRPGFSTAAPDNSPPIRFKEDFFTGMAGFA
jgi:hypothetical protein